MKYIFLITVFKVFSSSIGDIKISFLEEAKFRELYGKSWILLKKENKAINDIDKDVKNIFENGTLPIGSGCYLRFFSEKLQQKNAKIGQYQLDELKTKDLKFNILHLLFTENNYNNKGTVFDKFTLSGDHKHSLSTDNNHKHWYPDGEHIFYYAGSENNNAYMGTWQYYCGRGGYKSGSLKPNEDRRTEHGGEHVHSINSEPEHSHQINPEKLKHIHIVEESEEDIKKETAPRSIVVNYFIKVKDDHNDCNLGRISEDENNLNMYARCLIKRFVRWNINDPNLLKNLNFDFSEISEPDYLSRYEAMSLIRDIAFIKKFKDQLEINNYEDLDYIVRKNISELYY